MATLGKDWGTEKIVTAFAIEPPTDQGFLSIPGTIDVKLQASPDNFVSSVVDLYTATGLSRVSPITVNSGITLALYQYHRVTIQSTSDTGTASYELAISELTLIAFIDNSLMGYIGKDWGTAKKVAGFTLFPSSDHGFLSSGGTIDVTLEGSTDNFASSIVELYSATGLSNTAAINVLSGVTSTTAYRYHRVTITPTSYPVAAFSLAIAELTLNYVISSPLEYYTFSIVIDTYAKLKTWLAKMAWECRCYFRFAAARAELLLRPDTLTSDKTITAHMTAMDSSYKTLTRKKRSRLEDVINKIEAHYHRDASKSGTEAYRGIYKNSDAVSIQRYGEKEKPEFFNFDFVQDDTMAASVADFYLARYKDRKKLIELDVFLDNSELEFADGITLEELGNLLCEVQQANVEPGSGRDMRNDRIHLVVKEY